MANGIREAAKHGQSIWFDNISRALITTGALRGMVENDGLAGVTSNPAIFEKAISGSIDYEPALRALIAGGAATAKDVFEGLAIRDIQLAADILYPVYVETGGGDGFVSMEVSPHLAHQTQATIEEARRLRASIARDNVMIKVPGTKEGLPAIAQLIGEGINVNVTLLFSVERYLEVADAYLAGLERLLAAGGDPSRVASVASFFVSRIDSLVDDKLAQLAAKASSSAQRERLLGTQGTVAIANARVAYARYQDLVAGDRWKGLAGRGARPQRLLWASTSTKNPRYPKAMYVEELIGPDTVNTIPDETFYAFRAEGRVAETITRDPEGAAATIARLEESGIPLREVTDALLADGVKKFADAFDKLLGAVERRRQELRGGASA